MDDLLTKAGSQVVTFAIKSGISLASTYAIKSVSNFLQDKVPPDTIDAKKRKQFLKTKSRLQTRIEIISNAIDLIKLVAARGNTNLSSTLKLIRDLRLEIDEFDLRIQEFLVNKKPASYYDVVGVETSMRDLLDKIEEAIPLINLSLATSGANLNGSLASHVSPGRLLQASNIVNISNTVFNNEADVQVGPTFQLTLYSIFYHRGRTVNNRLNEISWKETFTKCDVSIWRKKSKQLEYEYVLKIKEDFDDGRYHDEKEEAPKVMEIDISTITRLFFSASGKLLKLEDRSSPVLVLKINHSFAKNSRESDELDEGDDDEQQEATNDWIEWIAFGEFESLYDYSDEEDEDDEENEDDESAEKQMKVLKEVIEVKETPNSLSLLEYIMRLCVLQSNDQLSILEIDDERLSLYLHDENPDSTTTSTNQGQNEGEFDHDSNSTPVKVVSKPTRKTSNLTSRLEQISLTPTNEKETPSTPSKDKNSDSSPQGNSPIPGEISTNARLTPWERDKLSRFNAGVGNEPQTPSLSNLLRKKVLQRNIKSGDSSKEDK